jgi:hypothetical protein
MIDKALSRLGIGLSLFFMVSELTYVNAKSLLYLVQEYATVDRFFAVTGSLAFSMVTVVVMRKSAEKWVKIVFPLFDVALVFCGFNLKFADAIIEGSDNPVRFWLTVFMALFTGMITYSLGIINYKEHSQSEIENSESKIKSLLEEVNSLQCQLRDSKSQMENYKTHMLKFETDNRSLESKLKEYQIDIEKTKCELQKLEGDTLDKQSVIDSLKSDIKNYQGKINELLTQSDENKDLLLKYREAYLVSERSRILKKKPQNRTEDECNILEEAGEFLQVA